MEDKLQKIRHSLAHVMAAAAQEIYPNVKFGIGPVIENGFYYDFDFSSENGQSTQITPEILPEIEKKMRALIKKGLPIEHLYFPMAHALKKAKIAGQIYKLELLQEIKNGKRLSPEADADSESSKKGEVSFYRIGHFTDLCKGPHVKNTKDLPIDGFKLTRLAGAYWKGDSANPQMQRIYAVAFETKKELGEYLELQRELEKRDHRKLGIELDFFAFSDLIGPGLPLWTPKGTLLRNFLDDFVWQLRQEAGYEQVDIPHITKKDLYEKSGHWEKFKDELFKINTREGHLFAMKPMNCPHHTQIYARKPHSYKELPVRYANTTKVYRDEQSGELFGASRVLSITQDDAHVFCRIEQAEEEVQKIWEIISTFYESFGFNLKLRLSLRDSNHPEKYLGNKEHWDQAEKILRKVAEKNKKEYLEAPGEATFYAPKLDFMAKDSLGREWQVATIQLDVNMPERFDLFCINEKGKQERIVMIHAAVMGSIERFLSVLIEHYAGAFPVWLSPIQAVIVPISEKFNDYAGKIEEKMKEDGLRVELDSRSESVGKKIREAEMQKTPYILVVGEKEEKAKTVAVRQRGKGDLGAQKIEKFIEKIQEEIQEKKSF